MSYLRTVVTYHQPSEAEVDKAYLESHGHNVCLLNANTARNELGPAFYIQLQVPDEEYDAAVALLKEVNPSRFGSAERVAQIEREMLRGFAWFAVPAAIFGLIGFVATPTSPYNDMRFPMALSCGGLAGIISVFVRKLRNRSRSRVERGPAAADSMKDRTAE
jgi:hypothetical protein